MNAHYLAHSDTGCFSKLLEDYLSGEPQLRPFFAFAPDQSGIDQAIADRKSRPVNRGLLTEVITDQYKKYKLTTGFRRQIESLRDENTFTICTAHQPNLLSGYLYFFYKIIHAIKLAAYLQERYPEQKFVPVFYIGSEDNDLEELGTFRFSGTTYRWHTNQTGAVGRMHTDDLDALLDELLRAMDQKFPDTAALKSILIDAYQNEPNIADATRKLVHQLVGERYGLLVLDADDRRLKQQFLPVIREELLTHTAAGLVRPQSAKLNEEYRAQAFAREINLFYLRDDLRERIVKEEGKWRVRNTDISWASENELIAETEQHPERFSPNVILRGLYQEMILPDIAFIGGGSEMAYWMQLRPLFQHYHVFFPVLIPRQSVLWMPKHAVDWQAKLHLTDADIFLPSDELVRRWVLQNRDHTDLSLAPEKKELTALMQKIGHRATQIDPTLRAASEATATRLQRQFDNLEKKMLRAEKRKYADKKRQLDRFKDLLFPLGSLQERKENFMEGFLTYGEAFFQLLFDYTLPFGDRFLILKDS